MTLRGLQEVDRRLMLYTLLLVGLGLVTVYGATSYQARLEGHSEWAVALNHAVRLAVGVAACFAAFLVPYRVSGRLALFVGLPVAVALLAVTVIGGKMVAENEGIPRWLYLFEVSVQPVEIAKLCLALALPYWIERHPESISQLRGGFLIMLIPLAAVLALLAMQPNYGSALAIAAMCASIFFLAGVRTTYLVGMVSVVGLFGWLGFAHSAKVQSRVDAWFDLLIQGDGPLQPMRALVALGSGGLRGEGLGAGTMHFAFLPEADTDFIFAILGEEMGFIGAVGVVLLFGLWIARVLKIAHRSKEGLAYLTAIALGCMIFVYATVNLLMVTALIPVAGLPLPFISRGGCALVTNMAAVGVLLNISATARRKRTSQPRWRELTQ